MNNLDRQAQMMDFLYGEMPPEARREYERWLEEHPEVQQEIADMQAGRDWLAEVEEVIPQPLMVDLSPGSAKVLDRKWWYRAGAAAAVLLALWLFNFQIRMDRGGLVLSFGRPESIQTPNPELPAQDTEAQMAAWKNLLANNQELLEQKIMGMDSSWQYRFAALQNENQHQWKQVKNAQAGQVQQVKQEFSKEQLPRLAALMQQLQTEQQEELRLLLVEFWNTWQETRQTDLEQINVKMTHLYQNAALNQQASEARMVDFVQKVAGR